METVPFVHWRNRDLSEVSSSLTLRRGSTHPDIGVEVLVGGEAYSLAGHSVKAQMRFNIFLRQELSAVSEYLKTSFDKRVREGDTLIVDDEKMLVRRVDAVSDPGYLRLRVTRGYSSTTATLHEAGTAILIYVLTRNATFLTSTGNNRVSLQWKAGDTDRVGDFDLEFDVTELRPDGARFTVPASPLPISILPTVG